MDYYIKTINNILIEYLSLNSLHTIYQIVCDKISFYTKIYTDGNKSNFQYGIDIADEIRKIYGLSRINEKNSSRVIEKLKGMLSVYEENKESAVDAIKNSRENLYR